MVLPFFALWFSEDRLLIYLNKIVDVHQNPHEEKFLKPRN